ncbi:hypothetical protein G7Y89_g3873 [Cudoniella acicularis]|uniref:Uncharacterized protein n=1 Tax=Cudoniella acicularis TaxID=354080 RepID=A0A8H4RRD3_9HELO|nr:hypothetical protein G7Y89_g3873 [Cudoniella acicularis]
MHLTTCLLASAGLWQAAHAVINLVPILPPDTGLDKRTTANVKLHDKTSVYWADTPSNASIMVNVTLETGDDEMIVSMDYFAPELQSVKCDGELALTFTSPDTYAKAIKDWSWVNFSQNRTFIMLVNYGNCSADSGRKPWLVNWANYDNRTNTVEFNATQKTWSDLQTGYTIQWGQNAGPTAPDNSTAVAKRSIFGKLDPHWNPSMHIDVNHDFSKNLYTKNYKGVNFKIDCANCGTKGRFNFAGHIKTTLRHPLTPSEMTMSVTPAGVEADLGLSLNINGKLASAWADEATFLEIPIEAIHIPDLLQVGPELTLSAGFSMQTIEGSATVSTGLTAKIPDSSIFFVDFLNSKNNKNNGWKPTLSTQPINVDAQINAGLDVYMKLAANLDCTVFNSYGMGVDLALQVPDIKVNVEADYSNKGNVCPNKKGDWGAKFSGAVGLDLKLQAWLQKGKDNKDYLYNGDLFSDPSLYTFPSVCFAFGSAPKTTVTQHNV